MKVGCSSNFVEAVLLCLILFPIGILADMPLRFRKDGTFKILQVADMHYANGKNTTCEDVFPSQEPYCSDLNTTAFLERTILAENPDLIVFTGMGFVCANIGRFLLYLLSSQSLNIILILFTFDTWRHITIQNEVFFLFRSEERRVGKECLE